MISIGRGSFSVVPTLARLTLPPVRTTPPPSARQNSALMASRWLSIMNCAPTSGAPSSPDSARKMTSRSSAVLARLSFSISIRRRDQVVLVVDRAATVDVAAVALGAEGRMGPLLRIDRHDVGVPHAPAAAASCPLPLIRATRLGRCGSFAKTWNGMPSFSRTCFEVLDGSHLVARRAAGVELHAGPGSAQRFGLERRVGLGICAARPGDE